MIDCMNDKRLAMEIHLHLVLIRNYRAEALEQPRTMRYSHFLHIATLERKLYRLDSLRRIRIEFRRL